MVPNDYMTSPGRLGSQHSPARTASLNQRPRTHRWDPSDGNADAHIFNVLLSFIVECVAMVTRLQILDSAGMSDCHVCD